MQKRKIKTFLFPTQVLTPDQVLRIPLVSHKENVRSQPNGTPTSAIEYTCIAGIVKSVSLVLPTNKNGEPERGNGLVRGETPY